MSEAAFTPGPWEHRRDRERDKIVGPTGHKIAGVVESLAPYKAEQRANARLIAAAPELLEALLALLPDTASDWRVSLTGNRVLRRDLSEEVVNKARAAISKARGRA